MPAHHSSRPPPITILTFLALEFLGTVPSDIGPQFSLTIHGTQWSFFFTDGDHFVDVDYTALYVSRGTTPVAQFDFPYYCAPWNTGRSAVGIPWDRSTQEFVPGDYKHDYRYS
jgi:hypothetical protein